MPDKEGSEDEKTTKGVVKKKQKQMMGEEGYDTYRDNILMRGGDHRSKETKERSYTPSKQPKGQTAAQKAAKGKSALELVKADITKKYGKGAIMDVKKKSKKKANEELDLTKIAEAFGGYIIESINRPKFYSSGTEKKFQGSVEGKALKKQFKRTEAAKKAAEKASQEAETASSAIDPSQKQFVQGGRYSKSKIPQEVRDPITGEPLTRDYDLPPKEQERKDKETKQTPEYQQAKAGAKQGVANPKEFSTYTGTQAEFDADKAERERKRSTGKGDGRKAGRTKEEKRTGKVTYQTFVNKPEVTGGQDRATDTRSSVYIPKPEEIEKIKPKPETKTETETETKRERNKRVRTAADKIIDDIRKGKDKEVEKLKPKKDKVIVKQKPKTKTETETETQTAVGGDGGKKPPEVTTSTGATDGGKEPSLVSKVAKFSKQNPATALLSLDALRKFVPSSSPFGVQGGRAGTRSAAR